MSTDFCSPQVTLLILCPQYPGLGWDPGVVSQEPADFEMQVAPVKPWTFQNILRGLIHGITLHLPPRKKKKESIVLFLLTAMRLMENFCFCEIYSRMGVYPHSSKYLTEMYKPSLRCCPERAAPVLSVTGSSEQTLRNTGLDVTYLFSLQLLPILEDSRLGSPPKLPLKSTSLQRPEVVNDLCLQH